MKLVSKVDLQKYTGLWYQVGRYPHFFQSDDCSESTAEYSFTEDGKIEVLNRCWKDFYSGEYTSEVRALGTPVDENGNWLRVLFYGIFPADYLIIELDSENYQWAAVTSPNENTLWILSREASLPEEVYSSIISSLEKKGFDSTKIIKTSRQR
ncbi:MAG: lipocalin family protein [Spirochaetales bacterium]|nr:lipocalin family protein [Spirochaetales bacterium]